MIARGAHLQAMRARGVRLMVDGSEHVVHPTCTDNAADVGPQDYVLVCLEAHSVPGALEQMHPLLGTNTAAVAMTNGIPYWDF